MTLLPTKKEKTDVPSQVFEQFLKDLAVAGMSDELIARLRKTLLEEKLFSDRALTAAILGEESLL